MKKTKLLESDSGTKEQTSSGGEAGGFKSQLIEIDLIDARIRQEDEGNVKNRNFIRKNRLCPLNQRERERGETWIDTRS